ncbi:MAG: hypothetical protein RL172_2796 [Bacteroidota bacterium]
MSEFNFICKKKRFGLRMKKWIATLVILLICVSAFTYLYIPNTINIKAETDIPATQQGLHRMLLDKGNVKKWWPGTATDTALLLHGNQYQFINNNISLLVVPVNSNHFALHSSLYIVSIQTDSVHLAWVGQVQAPANPVKRWQVWRAANAINNDWAVLLKSMRNFYSNNQNIYGIKVEKALVADSILITTSATTLTYPSTEFIYQLLDKLDAHAVQGGAQKTSNPMLNIEKNETGNYHVRVAQPLNKALPDAQGVFCKRMLGNGNILVAEVTGPGSRAAEAYKQIALYASDYQRVPPAIAFYSLVTNRRTQTDSSKWVTKIYFPVM